jgi:hypothetical protein
VIITSPLPNTIAQVIRDCMSVKCGLLFVIVKMPCVMLSVRWCDIFLMVPVSGEGKTGNKMSVYMKIWNGYLVSF